jgi:hypothetical protein
VVDRPVHLATTASPTQLRAQGLTSVQFMIGSMKGMGFEVPGVQTFWT